MDKIEHALLKGRWVKRLTLTDEVEWASEPDCSERTYVAIREVAMGYANDQKSVRLRAVVCGAYGVVEVDVQADGDEAVEQVGKLVRRAYTAVSEIDSEADVVQLAQKGEAVAEMFHAAVRAYYGGA